MAKRIIRVFPRKTTQTPVDEYAFVGWPQLFVPDADEVHISVAFTWDLPLAERLAVAWGRVAPTSIGGPGAGMRGEEFTPGMYLAPGVVITSRGCPNRCRYSEWECSVPQREGSVRELPITDGWNVQDDNLLACSDGHIRQVFKMLKRQASRASFSGGLEAARLRPWHVELLSDLNPAQIFFAYDRPSELKPLRRAGEMLMTAGMGGKNNHVLRCFVLIGYKGDSQLAAERRMFKAMRAGFLPQAMLYHDDEGRVAPGWGRFRWEWSRLPIVGTRYREVWA
jgi:hypothetical protein